MTTNTRLHKAKQNKNDEFYTQLSDIEQELKHYKEFFKGKTIFCNCDDPEWSNFWKYFELKFDNLGLKKLISTHYEDDKPSYKLEIIGDVTGDGKVDYKDIIKTPLKQNGDFRSPEAIEILKEADIVVTNPPFSLFREYIAQLIEYDKKFIIMGNKNAITYKEFFPLLKEDKIWVGATSLNGGRWMIIPKGLEVESNKAKISSNGETIINVAGVCWFTNLDISKRHEDLILYKQYNAEDYPTYDNYDAININKVTDIPFDYEGIMGVPITFMDKYNPKQFEILGMASSAGYNKDIVGIEFKGTSDARPLVNNKNTFARIFIKKRIK